MKGENEMRMKKWMAVMVSLGMMSMIFSGCGNGNTDAATSDESVNEENTADDQEAASGDQTRLTFWDFHTGSEADVIKGMVDEYNAAQDKVYIEYSTVNQSDYTTTLVSTAYANGECPDILWIEPSTFKKFSEAGILADLSGYYTDELKNDLLASCLNEATGEDGKIYTLPFECETLGLFYDADAMQEAGLEPPTTWDELEAAAKELTTDDRYGIVLPVEKTPYTMFNWWPFMWMNKAEVFDADGQVIVSSDEMAEVLDFWGSFYQNGYCPSSLQDGPWSIDNIANGVAAMQIGGTYMINAAEEYNQNGYNISVVPLPSPDGETYITAAGGQMMGVCSQSKNIDAAADFIFWCFGSDDITRASRWCTEAKFAYPARQSVIEANQEIYGEGLKKIFTDFYETAVPEPKYSSEVMDVLEDMLQQVMFGNVDGRTAAEDAQKRIEDIK